MASRRAGGDATDGRGPSLYVHLPFCAAKCHYCDFFSVPGEGQDTEALLEALLREVKLRAPRSPRTVYIGGGTPTYLGIEQLQRLFDALQAATNFRASATEVTVECNPESLSREKARALLVGGATRLSIGFQSLDPKVLELFGRVHDVEQSFRAFENARAAGCGSLNVDLIYASPGQTAESWRADLARVLALGPDHLSAYNLTFEEETLFSRWLEDGLVKAAPEELELELFLLTRAQLRSAGFEAYEVSNFARPGHACAHNIHYWCNGEYIGLGPSAVSKLGFERSGNVRALGAYRKSLATGERPVAWSEAPPPALRLMETWWLGLRLAAGVDPRAARATAGFDEPHDPALDVADALLASGHLERRGERYAIPALHVPLADAIARRFLAHSSLANTSS